MSSSSSSSFGLTLLAALLAATVLIACGGSGGGDAQVDSAPVGAASEAPAIASVGRLAYESQDLSLPDTSAACVAAPAANAAAAIRRVWLAQNHFMETSWPFYYLLRDRDALLKVDVSDGSGGAAPQAKVVASWSDGSSETLCMRAPAALPATVDMEVQPARQDLTTSYVLRLPARWMRSDLALSIQLEGGARRDLPASELRIVHRPQMEFTTLDFLLFGDTDAQDSKSWRAEWAGKLPASEVQIAHFPTALNFERVVIAPRSDGFKPDGTPAAMPASWASSTPHCSAADKAAASCTPYTGFGVIAFVMETTRELRDANGLGAISSGWYGALGKKTPVYSGLGGGHVGSGDNYGLFFNHEMGHGFGLPHWSDVVGDKGGASLRYPYPGARGIGDGAGQAWGLDTLSGQPVAPISVCNPLFEAGDPMGRNCQSTAAGRAYEAFSDFSLLMILRDTVGGAALQGQVPYRNAALLGSAGFLPMDYAMPAESARAYVRRPTSGPAQIMTTDSSGAALELRRPPAGDAAFYTALQPATPAGVFYDKYFDFRYPQAFDTPVVTVHGTYNHSDHRMSSISAPIHMTGNLMRLWDPTDEATFAAIKLGLNNESFWRNWDLHLRVEYVDGTKRHVALPKGINASAAPESSAGFARWAVNLPDDGRRIARLSLLYRPLCARNASATDRSCDINHVPNGITAANVYEAAVVAATLLP